LNDELSHGRATAGGAVDLLKGLFGNIGAAEALSLRTEASQRIGLLRAIRQ
jgi:hypothetical protein